MRFLRNIGWFLLSNADALQARVKRWGWRLALSGLTTAEAETATVRWFRARGVPAYTLAEVAAGVTVDGEVISVTTTDDAPAKPTKALGAGAVVEGLMN